MAKYDVKFSCGHTETVNLLGKKDVRAWRIKQMQENEICSKCKEQRKQEYREGMLRRAEELEKEHDLPKLSGTPKQIEWARQIRSEIIDRIPKVQKRAQSLKKGAYEKKSVEEIETLIGEIFEKVIMTETSASFWINGKGLYPDEVHEFEKLRERYEQKEARKEAQKIEKEIEKEITVLPENFNEKPLVKIVMEYDKVEMYSARDEDIIRLVKSLRFEWNGEAWRKVIDYKNAPATDRAAELGNRLLSLGYGIICAEERVRQKAISGEIDPEHRRWIDVEKGNENFMFFFEKNHDLYEKVRKIPTSFYNNGVIYASITQYQEVEEKAALFDFRFSYMAKEAIAAYKKRIESLPRQTVKSIEKNRKGKKE